IPRAIFENIPPSDGLFCPLYVEVPGAGEYYLLTKDSMQNDPAAEALRDWLLSEAEELAAKMSVHAQGSVMHAPSPSASVNSHNHPHARAALHAAKATASLHQRSISACQINPN